MAIATGVIAINPLLTRLALIQVAPKNFGSTVFNIAHRFQMTGGHILPVFSLILSPILPEDGS
jgi:hypothetical protein